MNTSLLLVILVLQVFAVYYLIRTARNLGSKATKNHKVMMENISQIRAATSEILLNQLLIPNSKEFKTVNWEHVVSLTSHPERFNTLSQTLNSLLAQRLIAKNSLRRITIACIKIVQICTFFIYTMPHTAHNYWQCDQFLLLLVR